MPSSSFSVSFVKVVDSLELEFAVVIALADEVELVVALVVGVADEVEPAVVDEVADEVFGLSFSVDNEEIIGDEEIWNFVRQSSSALAKV